MENTCISVPLHCSASSTSAVVYHVSVTESITLPGYSQMLIPGKLQSPPNSSTAVGCIQPCDKFLDTYSVAMASVVTAADEDGYVPIRLQNFLPRPATIRKGTLLGTFNSEMTVLDDSQEQPVEETGACAQVEALEAKPHELFQLDHIPKNHIQAIQDGKR